ncbi:hypothetical protein ALI22I_04375 [Saccharothrix sp. ALI-22-I]|uniref:DUF397 domain-containing protein n=1 Tax=Saccharothrix sp. ALI-22-I TaxID=1933778 RepID=UPI00097C6F37|nr:DUF397 domain-containing protein [Saccharothrix sp. ALI-22-I]ONI92381.1 hypothetical protein ALI22I_04375 [Saccharothrix sp. ALI-22-I]
MTTPTQFRKSSHSGDSNCVEVARDSRVVRLRDSKQPEGMCVQISANSFRTFVSMIKAYR